MLPTLKRTPLLLALAALAATSCSLQIDSQYGLRWDRRVTVPQRSESEVTEAQPPAETEAVPEVHAVESKPQIETVRPYAAPHAEEADLALPFGIEMAELPEALVPHVERRLEKTKQEQSNEQHVKKSLADPTGSIAIKIAGVVLGVCVALIGALAIFVGYFVNLFDSDEAQRFFQLGVVFLVLGALFIILPQFI